MELSLLLFKYVIMLGMMIAAAFLLVKFKVVTSEDARVVSSIATVIVNPLVIVNSFCMEYDEAKIKGLFISIGVTFLLQVIVILVLRILQKPLKFDNIDKTSIIYSNAGNLVIPLVNAMLGPEAVFYCTAYIIAQNILLWSHGYILVSGQKKVNFKKIIMSPNIIAIITGFIILFFRIPLPDLLTKAISEVAGANAPINMFAIGMLLAGISFSDVFRDLKAYLVIGFRLILCPLFTIAFLAITGLPAMIKDGHTIFLILTIGSSASPAVALANIASMNGNHKVAGKASALNSMGIILCVITMPIMTLLYELIIP